MNEELMRLSEMTDNDDLMFLLGSIALEVEMGNWGRIHSMAQAVANVQDIEVFRPNGIDAPRRDAGSQN